MVALLLALAALCAGCQASDADIQRDVRTTLDGDPQTAGLAIEVRNRVVNISGKTESKEQQERAMTLVRSVDGVKLVVNDMWVNNAVLASEVKRALAADELVGHIPFEVEASGDIVRLMSDQTNAEQRTRAVAVASAIEGVGQVEDLMK